MSDNNLKRKKRSFYKQSCFKKKSKNNELEVNMRGFLITCNNNEAQAVAEAYNILNEYADKLYGVEEHLKQNESETDDIETALENQVNILKSKISERRFKNMETNINNCIFIKTTLSNPSHLLERIFDYENKGLQPCKVRFILRFLPVINTCKPNDASIEKITEEALLPIFANLNHAPTYSILYKIRNNNSINKEIIYSVIGRVIESINPLAKVNLDNPEIVISVDVLQKICCLSILPHYKQFKKYNLHEMSNSHAVDLEKNTSHKDNITDTSGISTLGTNDNCNIKSISK